MSKKQRNLQRKQTRAVEKARIKAIDAETVRRKAAEAAQATYLAEQRAREARDAADEATRAAAEAKRHIGWFERNFG